jgi:hypothetical protein
MDFTPEDMEAVQACFVGIDRNVPVSVEATAARAAAAPYGLQGRGPASARDRFIHRRWHCLALALFDTNSLHCLALINTVRKGPCTSL